MGRYAGQDAHSASHSAQQEHQQHEMEGDESSGGAHRFHYRDGALFFIQKRLQGALNAESGYDQDKESHQLQEKEKIVQKAFDGGAGRQVGVDVYRIVRDRLLELFGHGIDPGRVQDLDEHDTADAAARGHQAEGFKVRGVDKNPRAK